MFGSRALIPIVDTGAGGKRDMFRYTRVSIGFGKEGVGWDESPRVGLCMAREIVFVGINMFGPD